MNANETILATSNRRNFFDSQEIHLKRRFRENYLPIVIFRPPEAPRAHRFPAKLIAQLFSAHKVLPIS